MNSRLQMKKTTQVNVFYKSDGKCIHGENIDKYIKEEAENVQEIEGSIGPDTLIRLVKVFVQFSREVQGGNVKRLLFRNPQDYAPKAYRFQPTPRSYNKPEKRPIIVHVAHDDIFVVTVTEIILEDLKSYQILMVNENQGSILSLCEFCESLLDWLRREQKFFLSNLKKSGNGEELGEMNTRAYEEDEDPTSVSSTNDIVQVDEGRLAEYISNMTKSFLRN